jgi:hypothetical protein
MYLTNDFEYMLISMRMLICLSLDQISLAIRDAELGLAP